VSAPKCLIQTLLTRCCQEPFPTLQLSGMWIEGEAEPLRRVGCPTNRLTFLDFAKHRFEVDHWCAIDGFYWTDSQTLLAYFAYGDLSVLLLSSGFAFRAGDWSKGFEDQGRIARPVGR
jgi:hypothetical protein